MQKKKELPTQERLKELFIYDAERGYLINGPTRKSRCGKLAGSTTTMGYIQVFVDGQLYAAHRLIWVYLHGSLSPSLEIDHIDHDKLNNRPGNLRLVNPSVNQQNRTLSRASNTGHCGVYKRVGYSAHIGYFGKQIRLGNFRTLKEAVAARKAAEIKYGYHPNHGLKSENEEKITYKSLKDKTPRVVLH